MVINLANPEASEHSPSQDHKACASCKLYQTAPEGTRFVMSVSDSRTDVTGWQRGMIVVSGWAGDMVEKGKHPGIDLLQAFLDQLQCPWVIVGTTRCGRGPGSPPLSLDNHKLCSNAFLSPDLMRWSPTAIMCLGKEAMAMVLGKLAPKSISSATRKTLELDGLGLPVLVGVSPFAHRPIEGQSIVDQWIELFSRFQDEVLGIKRTFQFPYREIGDYQEAMSWARAHPRDFTFDTEVNTDKNDPSRRTMWHGGAQLLCYSAAKDEPDGTISSTTIVPPAALRPEVLNELFRGSRVGAHFAKVDFQVPWATLGVNIFPLVRRLSTGEVDVDDPGTDLHLNNQAQPGLGLLPLVQKYRPGTPNWKAPVKQAQGKRNAELLRMKIQHDAAVRFARRRADYQARADAGEVKAQKWLRSSKNAPRPIPPLPPIPTNSAGFDSAIPYLYHYCSEDSVHTRWLSKEVVPKETEAHGGQHPVLRRLLARMMELTAMIERVGLPVSLERLEAAERVFSRRVLEGKRQLLGAHPEVVRAAMRTNDFKDAIKRGAPPEEAALVGFNPQAPPFRLALCQEMGYDLSTFPRTDKGKGKNPSTDKHVIKTLSGGDALWENLDEKQRVWRNFSRLKSVSDLQAKLGTFRWIGKDGRIHTDYRIVKVEKGSGEGSEGVGGTETGRLSSRDPNLQNLKKDPAFRALFVAPPGWMFLEADYDQGEPRVLAWLADCPGWKQIFQRGLDVYQVFANDVYKLGVDMRLPDAELRAALKEVAPKEGKIVNGVEVKLRDAMKPVLLAVMYMKGVRSFAVDTGLPLEEAQEIMNKFFVAYPEIKRYQEDAWEAMHRQEPCRTPFHRQKLLPWPNPRLENYDEELAANHRHLCNFPIQSTLSDICCWMGWELMREMQAAGWWGTRAEICNPVHDALWSLVREEDMCELARWKVRLMEDRKRLPFDFPVPLTTSLKAGYDLSKLDDLDKVNPVWPIPPKKGKKAA